MDDDSQRAGTEPIVVALGGNTLLGSQGHWTFDEQREAVARTARQLADAIHAGYDVVLTHGNGPQVGTLLLQQDNVEEPARRPLDVLVAETQAQIGYLVQQALDNELPDSTDSVTVVTQVVVDPDDPAFETPTKPVGPFYTEAQAAERAFETRRVRSGDRPYRRVVPSPEPIEVVEDEEITSLVERGTLVVAAGGGGVPVVRDGTLRGVEAVVDKDKTSQVLAAELGAETLVVLTDVEFAYVGYETADERPLRRVSPAAVRGHLEAGEFGEGSMRPKMEACCRFVERGGERAVVTTPDRLLEALAGETGTQVRA
ncbi:carbamate kinase [Salinirubellus salinus]|uniref:Carbamate kinase n=1 Tax=Salinirubellus salinus TaxID=1364945 RepID=A0A9E7R384_9EURY|nr:carbamate kinase [Salinirubellus salinus]UWM54662.1 carbamate kinase [Salinirubellus salinus]UWM54731.1 carbamate kinase [Salinirubellus salinus]